MKNYEVYKYYNDIENMVLCSSSNTDEFLMKMKSVDIFFENFEGNMIKFSESLKKINIDDYIIKERWYQKILKKLKI